MAISNQFRYRTQSTMLFTVSDGIRVRLAHFTMGPASNLLAGGAIDHQAAFAPFVERVFPDTPFKVVTDPSRDQQGEIACLGCFFTTDHKPDTDSLGSSLTLGWYVDHMDHPVRSIIRAGLDLCDWAAVCRPDYWS